jgi:hypothetical protein
MVFKTVKLCYLSFTNFLFSLPMLIINFPSKNVNYFVTSPIHFVYKMCIQIVQTTLLVTDKFVFDNRGNVYLKSKKGVGWSTNTPGQRATAVVLKDLGNLVLLGDNGKILWQSFSHPTNTLLQGMQFQHLEIMSGDLFLYARYGSTTERRGGKNSLK